MLIVSKPSVTTAVPFSEDSSIYDQNPSNYKTWWENSETSEASQKIKADFVFVEGKDVIVKDGLVCSNALEPKK